MKNKQLLLLYVIPVLLLVIAAYGGYYFGRGKIDNVLDNIASVCGVDNDTSIPVDTVSMYTTYYNDQYGYHIEYENRNEDFGENITYSSTQGNQSDIVSFETYTEEYGHQPVGDIYCTDTIHKGDTYGDIVGLNEDMTLEDYANTIYEDKIARGLASVQKAQPARGDMGMGTFATLEAFDFIIVEKAFRIQSSAPLEVNRYIITENPQGKRCIIRYPEFDYAQEDSTEMHIARQHWIKSFRWNGLE